MKRKRKSTAIREARRDVANRKRVNLAPQKPSRPVRR